ncbi:MAG: DUF1572 family protein [Phycisphaeraceae bacterium]|nr:DUF1572 family protein [Phycisphaeraceae bacterium]
MNQLIGILRGAWLAELAKQRAYIEGAVGQLSDDQFRARPGGTGAAEGTAEGAAVNSCAVIVKHLAGNLRSRWTDWRTTDGEKPDRDREGEFVDAGESREELMRRLGAGFDLVTAAVEGLTEEDLTRVVRIRCEPHSVPLAINRSLAHAAYHAGQVMIVARMVSGHGADGWKWLTVKPGGSAAHNEAMKKRFGPRG